MEAVISCALMGLTDQSAHVITAMRSCLMPSPVKVVNYLSVCRLQVNSSVMSDFYISSASVQTFITQTIQCASTADNTWTS